jgi:tRNA acetyltransferase TAN1
MGSPMDILKIFMGLLISYPWNHFSQARAEAKALLERFGDPDARIEKTGVPGIAVAHTTLDNRDVIRKCRRLFQTELAFQYTTKWVPVDFWCDTTLEAMKEVIEREIIGQIKENETWAMKVQKRRWQQYHTKDIIDYLAASIDRRVNLSRPDKIVRVDVLGKRTSISLLRPDEIFSIAASV